MCVIQQPLHPINPRAPTRQHGGAAGGGECCPTRARAPGERLCPRVRAAPALVTPSAATAWGLSIRPTSTEARSAVGCLSTTLVSLGISAPPVRRHSPPAPSQERSELQRWRGDDKGLGSDRAERGSDRQRLRGRAEGSPAEGSVDVGENRLL